MSFENFNSPLPGYSPAVYHNFSKTSFCLEELHVTLHHVCFLLEEYVNDFDCLFLDDGTFEPSALATINDLSRLANELLTAYKGEAQGVYLFDFMLDDFNTLELALSSTCDELEFSEYKYEAMTSAFKVRVNLYRNMFLEGRSHQMKFDPTTKLMLFPGHRDAPVRLESTGKYKGAFVEKDAFWSTFNHAFQEEFNHTTPTVSLQAFENEVKTLQKTSNFLERLTVCTKFFESKKEYLQTHNNDLN